MTRYISRKNKLILSNLYSDVKPEHRQEFWMLISGELCVWTQARPKIVQEVLLELGAALVLGDLLSVLEKLEVYAGTEPTIRMVRKILDMRREFMQR